MGWQETDVSHRAMIHAGPLGCTLFKNVRGLFKTLDGLRKVLAGLLVPGASDLIGWTSIIITPDMVGCKIAVFTAMESKTRTGVAKDEQETFIKNVREAGGFAGVVRSESDVEKIIQNSY